MKPEVAHPHARGAATTAFQAVVAVLLALMVGASAPEGSSRVQHIGAGVCIVQVSGPQASSLASAVLCDGELSDHAAAQWGFAPTSQLLRASDRALWRSALPPPARA